MRSHWQKLLHARLALLARLLLVLLVSSSIIEVSGFGCGTACDAESLSLAELEAESDQAPSVTLRSATHLDDENDCSCPCQCPGGCSSSCRVVAALPGLPPQLAPPVEIGAHSRAQVSSPPSNDPFGILHVPRSSAV